MNISDYADQMTVEHTGTVDGAECYDVTDESTGITYTATCMVGQWTVEHQGHLVVDDEHSDLWAAVVTACTDAGQEAQA